MAARVELASRAAEAWPVDAVHISTDALAQRHPHPRDATIRFDEGPHLYYVRDSPTPLPISGTGVVHALFDTLPSSAFIEAMRQETRAAKYAGMSDDDILAQWRATGARSSMDGTRMHAAIETYWNTYDPVTRTGFITRDPVLQCEMALFRQFLEHEFWPRELEPWRTEMIVHDDIQVAGSIDFIARSARTGEFYVFDWKRVREIKCSARGRNGFSPVLPAYKLENVNYVHYSLQLHLYRHMLMQHYGLPHIPVANLYLVVIHPNDASYSLVQCADLSHVVPHVFTKMPEIIARHTAHKNQEHQ